MPEIDDKYTMRLISLEQEQVDWLATWQDISDYQLPKRGMYVTKGDNANRGTQRYSKIFDAKATRALRILGAGMQSGLTSPVRPWFRLKLDDPDLTQWQPVKLWLDEVERIMYDRYRHSNFYNAVHVIYEELGGFGTGCLLEERDSIEQIRFRPNTAGEYFLDTNERLVVDTFYRVYWMQPRNVIAKFGEENVSEFVKKTANNQYQGEWTKIAHCIQPNDAYDPGKRDNSSMEFESVYWEYQDGNQLSKSGYRMFPLMCPRWTVNASEVYGRSPGMDALPDTKSLQEIAKSITKAIHKMVEPPMKAPGSLRAHINTIPGGVTYIDNAHNDKLEPLYDIKFDVQSAAAKQEDIRIQIAEHFYSDLFLMIIDKPNMTATEVLERSQEKMLQLGPVIERQINELLDPLIDRTFQIMMEDGSFPPPPEEIQGQNIGVEYISLLAQAQKLTGTAAVNSLLNFSGGLAQLNPSIIDKLNGDELVDIYADLTGVPAKAIRTNEQVARIREARAQQEAQAKMQEQLQAGVSSVKDLGQASTQEGTALGDLTRALSGI